MPRHYLLTTCLISVCDHVVLLYVVRRICRTSYVVRLHHCMMALTWHFPSHGAVPGADRWESVGGGIGICSVVNLQRLGYIGLRKVWLVMWLAKQG